MPTIFLLSPFCPLRQTTNRIFDLRLCDGFAANGCDVAFWAPFEAMPDNIDVAEIGEVYGLAHPVPVDITWTPLDAVRSSKFIGRLVLLWVGLLWSVRILRQAKGRADWVYSRDPKLLIWLAGFRVLGFGRKLKLLMPIHEVKSSRTYRFVYRRTDRLLCLSTSAHDVLRRGHGIARSKLIMLWSPVPDRLLTNTISREAARDRLGLGDITRPLIVYTGKLAKGIREVEYILDAAALTPEFEYLLTGGKPEVVDYFSEHCAARGIQNVRFTGFVKHVLDVHRYQCAADVLVSYYTTAEHMVEFNVPQKLTEYFVTGNPVVTPDYPATAGIVSDKTAFLVEPNDVQSLVDGIRRSIDDPDRARNVGSNAREVISRFTFSAQCASLMSEIGVGRA